MGFFILIQQLARVAGVASAGRSGAAGVNDTTDLRAASRALLLALARDRETDMPNQSMELRHLAASDYA